MSIGHWAILLALSACGGDESESRIGPVQSAAKPGDARAKLEAGIEASKEPVRQIGADDLDVLFLSIDTLRADHLDCYGYARKTAPHLTELAAQGACFEQAIANWPKTAPSFASMLTSTYGSTNGLKLTLADQRLPMIYETLPEIAHAAGYETLGVVSNLSLDERYNFHQGFDHYVCEGVQNNADVITADAQKLLAARDRSRRYFMWVHYLDPHGPYRPPKEFLDRFVGDATYQADQRPPMKVAASALDKKAKPQQADEIGQIPAYAYLEGKNRMRDYVAAYDGDIAYCDDRIGQLLAWMKKEGHLDHTAIVVVADHGEGMGGHDYFFEHGRLPYEDCAHVPLIMVHPKLAPARVAAPFALLDMAPTLLDLLGLRAGWQSEGRSRVEWLQQGAPIDAAAPVFTESSYSKDFTVAMRRGNWKLIRFCDPAVAKLCSGRPYELYDLAADPAEEHDRLDDEPDRFESMREELDAYVEIARKRVPPTTTSGAVAITPEEQKRIEALGYTEGEH